jgi:hypothetical protein
VSLNIHERGFTLKRIAVLAAICGLTGILVTTLPGLSQADDDWELVSSNAPAPFLPAGHDEPMSAGPKVVTVCGEKATSAAPHVQEMVDRINELWRSHVTVYQSIAPEQPCIWRKAFSEHLSHGLSSNLEAVGKVGGWGRFKNPRQEPRCSAIRRTGCFPGQGSRGRGEPRSSGSRYICLR